MSELYPEIEPYRSGMLDVGDGNQVYWEVCGNPAGKPAVVLHGGPGLGCTPRHRRFLDPERYRIVVFDQRGCGRSTPNAGSPGFDLSANTTWHLVADMERLREHLGIERWMVFGGSWGSTLGLAYAETHPDRVTEMLLFGIFTARRREWDWYWGGGAGVLFPELWHRFLDAVPEHRRGDIIGTFHELLNDPDPLVRSQALAAWDGLDVRTAALLPPAEPSGPRDERAYTAARICLHYMQHDAWLAEGSLLRDAGRLAGIPGIIVQGRYDVQAPAVTAWELSRIWRAATLVMVENGGHSPLDPNIEREIVHAGRRITDAPTESQS